MNLRLMQQKQFVAYINKYKQILVFQWIVTSFHFSYTRVIAISYILHITNIIIIINANN